MTVKTFCSVFAILYVLLLVLCGCSSQVGRPKTADQIVREFVAAGNSHDVERQASLFTDDCIYEDVALGKINHGKDEFRAFAKEFFTGAPDIKEELKSVIASGDHVAVEWILSSTHTGDWPDLRADGKSFSMRGVSVIELKDGKILHVTDYGVQPQTETTDPFVGTWKLNVAKSKATDPSALPKSEISKWEGLDNGMKAAVNGVDAAGNAYQIEISAKYDGKDYALKGYPLADTLAQKKIDATTLEMIAKKARQEVERWQITISKDGKTQTWAGKGKNSKGKEFNGTFVYDRQ